MARIAIMVTIAPGREDEVPKSLTSKINRLLSIAFEELIDDGIIDIITIGEVDVYEGKV